VSLLRICASATFCLTVAQFSLAQVDNLRPPAVPLITSDPYLSVWSEADHATDDVTRHWTKHPHPLVSIIKIDGDNFRILGNSPSDVPALLQIGLKVTATKTTYTFANKKVLVEMSFLTPALPARLDVYARPVTYLHWDVKPLDKSPHQVEIYESTSSLLSVEDPAQKVTWKREKFGNLTALRAGTEDQTLLSPAGDDTRIDWGYVYAVAPTATSLSAIGSDHDLKDQFLSHGVLRGNVDGDQPRPASTNEPVLAFSFDLGEVKGTGASAWMMVGYDEIYSIDYFGRKLRPYWRRNGAKPSSLFLAAERDYKTVSEECQAFDEELETDATKVGGEKYAQILALSYRECVAANGLAADAKGMPLLFTKENTSNGDIATVDVIFPMDPIWVFLSPTLAKASLVSNFMYAASPHWKFPNAPHDLGTYPQVFGRDDGGEGMPVEESGNMILLTDAVAHDEKSPEFATKFWPQLTEWAKYLEKYGLDPEDQLCTDDFMGHLAHNANLSVKAILALAAYGDLCKMKGDTAGATKYAKLAKDDAAHWMQVADEGDHSLLAFDRPGTWSQKYNLVWDQILGLNVFPQTVRAKEVSYYQQKLLPYGVPLDSRTHLTKTDWSIWSATLALNQTDFEAIVDPIYTYLDGTTARDPIADSYETDNLKSGGMHARPVVGGFFVKMLTDPLVWQKWEGKDHMKVTAWAPLPKSPKIQVVVPAGNSSSEVVWKYTTDKPSDEWFSTGFNDASWKTGTGGFGTVGTPAVKIGTEWNTDDIWMRRTVVLPKNLANLKLYLFHDEDVEVYIDGVLADSEPGFISDYEVADISQAARKRMKPGGTTSLAVHCHQTTGGQGIDVGFAVAKG
jgi:hypothetical protein